jgi:DNA-binding FadR family transcriptional regulator
VTGREGERRPLRAQSLGQQMVADLLDRIASGEFRPGDRLPVEHELMRQYGTGRNTVREAVQSLVALDLVEVRRRRGAIVLATSPQRVLPPGTLSVLLDTPVVDDLYDVRLLLETHAAARAASHVTPERLAPVTAALRAFVTAYTRGAPVWQADLDFHYAIAQASGNSVIPRLLEAAAELLTDARRATAEVPEAVERAVREHTRIHDAIQRGDPDEASEAMREHIESGIWAVRQARALVRQRQREARDEDGRR